MSKLLKSVFNHNRVEPQEVKPAEEPTPNFEALFSQAVNNSQPTLALTYLVEVINGLDARIQALESDTVYADAKSVDNQTETPEVEETPKPKRAPVAKKADADGE